MARPWHDALRRPAGDLPFLVLCLATALGMFRAVDEPDVSVHVGGTDISIVPTDLAILLLGVCCVVRLLGRRSLPRPARSITAAAGAFAVWLLISSAVNGFTTVVGAVKVLEYAILGLGAVLFLQRRSTFWSFVALLVAVCAVADLVAVKGFIRTGARQDSFTGAHDLAALGAMVLALALAAPFVREHRLGRLPLIAGITGSIAVILGAALASLTGLYLAAAAILGVAVLRHAINVRGLLAMGAVLAVVTAGALYLRSQELGFLNQWFGSHEQARPGQYAASWSQRLVFAYIGGRVFLDNPVVGTGWYGELPPKEWQRYLPDAKRRFPDQPANYFPQPGSNFTPQQTYDQVLYELGLVGAALFLVLGILTVHTAWRVGRRWPIGGADEIIAPLPLAWTGSLIGALAGAALFGGIPMTAIFWLTIGLVALSPSLIPPEPVAELRVQPAVPAPA